MQRDFIRWDDPCADALVEELALRRMRHFRLVRPIDDANRGEVMWERVMEAACVLKSYYNPDFIDLAQIVREIAPEVMKRFPASADRALRRITRLMQAA